MTTENRNFGEILSIPDEIQTIVASIKIKQDRFQADERQASEKVLALLGQSSDLLPLTDRGEIVLPLNQSLALRTKREIVYDPMQKEIKHRVTDEFGIREGKIEQYDILVLNAGPEIAKEIAGRIANIDN